MFAVAAVESRRAKRQGAAALLESEEERAERGNGVREGRGPAPGERGGGLTDWPPGGPRDDNHSDNRLRPDGLDRKRQVKTSADPPPQTTTTAKKKTRRQSPVKLKGDGAGVSWGNSCHGTTTPTGLSKIGDGHSTACDQALRHCGLPRALLHVSSWWRFWAATAGGSVTTTLVHTGRQ